MAKKLRILAGGDLHGSKEIAERLAKKAQTKKADIIILAGDIAGMGELEETILEPFTKRKQKVLFIPGNWDDTEDIEILNKHAKNIDGTYVTYNGIRIAGIGNKDWKMRLDNKEEKTLETLFQKMNHGTNILISHLHPQGTKAEFSGVQGDEILRKTIDKHKPTLHICAHIHEAEGLTDKIGSTNIIQVGRKGTLIEI